MKLKVHYNIKDSVPRIFEVKEGQEDAANQFVGNVNNCNGVRCRHCPFGLDCEVDFGYVKKVEFVQDELPSFPDIDIDYDFIEKQNEINHNILAHPKLVQIITDNSMSLVKARMLAREILLEQQGGQERPSFINVFMKLADFLARRSTCSRLKVGAVVTSEHCDKVYGIGYNGNYAGGENKCDSDEPGNCGCLHAEENALLKVSEDRNKPKIMFLTHAPCKMCAKRIINKGGFIRVYYRKDYRSEEGIELLANNGISIVKI